MTDERRIEVEAEVPGTPEQVWEAIATGPGITAWFMPAEVEGRRGGSVVYRHDGGTASTGVITAHEPPHRFAYQEEAGEFVPTPHVMATEFLVEARGGDSCVVRVVMSGFGDGEAWQHAIDSFTAGWRQALRSLRLYLTHFRGEPVGSVTGGAKVPADGAAWPRLLRALGLPEGMATGDRVATTGPGTPGLAGTVVHVGDHMATLLLDKPARGIGLIGAGGAGGETFLTVRAQLFGADAATVAERERRAWQEWFGSRWEQAR